MGFWRFADQDSLDGLVQLVPSYNYTLGWVAGLLAVIAGFALFPTLARIRSSRTAVSRRAWQLGGAVTMGLGFWGTQNMALLGFELNAYYVYDPVIGLVALLPAIAGCAVAIQVLAERSGTLARLNFGALSLAAGIAGMHYTLMEAIHGDIILVYTSTAFVQSLVLGYGFALVALYVNRAMDVPAHQDWVRRFFGSVVFGVSVLGNHFSAMSGALFFDDPNVASTGVAVLPAYMILAIAGCVLFMVTAYWIGSLVDGRLAEASAAVRSSEARHRAVIETMLDAHLVVDRDMVVRSFNPAAEALFGWQAAEIVGRPGNVLFNADGMGEGERWSAQHPAALGHMRRRWVHANGGRRKDGTTFPIEIAVSPFDVNGERFISSAVRDLSSSWEAEARLRRLAAAIEQAGDAICILDADYTIRYVNPQYERQTGFSASEVVGSPPARGAGDDHVYAEIWNTVSRGKAWSGQLRSRRRDGSLFDEEVSLTPVFGADGTVSGYVAVMRDVSGRLAAELERRRLAEALQHCTDSIEILDNQGRIVYVNAAFEATAGQRLADIRGSRPEAIADFAPAGDSYDEMMRTAYRGGRPWSGILKSVDISGDLREEEVTVSPMRDDRGDISGYVVVKRDVADRRKQELQAQQQERLRSIGGLADGISHELAAPMRNLSGHLEALRSSFGQLDRLLLDLAELGERATPVAPATIAGCLQGAGVPLLRREIVHTLEHSIEEAGEIAEIIDAMHDISHTSSARAAVDLNRAIQSAITITASEWRPVAEMRTELDRDLPALHCMAAEIGLVLLNLLVSAAHAIAATGSGGIRGKGVISIATRRANDRVEVRVSDTGSGVAPDLRARLFDPQFASTPAGARHGLALAHEIITVRHGGSIGLESDGASGATVTIRLPLAQPAAAAGTAAA